MENDRKKLLSIFALFKEVPSDTIIFESANCSKCRDYHQKKGPVCKHCKLLETLLEYKKRLNAYRKKRVFLNQLHEKGNKKGSKKKEEIDDREFNEERVDGSYLMLIKVFKQIASKFSLEELGYHYHDYYYDYYDYYHDYDYDYYYY